MEKPDKAKKNPQTPRHVRPKILNKSVKEILKTNLPPDQVSTKNKKLIRESGFIWNKLNNNWHHMPRQETIDAILKFQPPISELYERDKRIMLDAGYKWVGVIKGNKWVNTKSPQAAEIKERKARTAEHNKNRISNLKAAAEKTKHSIENASKVVFIVKNNIPEDRLNHTEKKLLYIDHRFRWNESSNKWIKVTAMDVVKEKAKTLINKISSNLKSKLTRSDIALLTPSGYRYYDPDQLFRDIVTQEINQIRNRKIPSPPSKTEFLNIIKSYDAKKIHLEEMTLIENFIESRGYDLDDKVRSKLIKLSTHDQDQYDHILNISIANIRNALSQLHQKKISEKRLELRGEASWDLENNGSLWKKQKIQDKVMQTKISASLITSAKKFISQKKYSEALSKYDEYIAFREYNLLNISKRVWDDHNLVYILSQSIPQNELSDIQQAIMEKAGYSWINDDWRKKTESTLDWEILPPEFWRYNSITSEISESMNKEEMESFLERLIFIDKFNPTQVYKSKFANRGYQYFVYLFKNHVVAECPEYGNAAYILPSNSKWQDIFRLSRREIKIKYKNQITIVRHIGDWRNRIKTYLN